ncbi:family 78 glycoside hydrolase catalytic domain [Microbacterium helvum]|nr:family 78 glycoside hydrolase catalytic domain [Microbacterium helvum]
MTTDALTIPSTSAAGIHPFVSNAAFIGPSVGHGLDDPAPALTREVDVRDGLVRATLHVSALGAYDLTVNGVRSSDRILAPGWTAYDHRLRFHSDDVTAMLRTGRNTIRGVLGNGWYRGKLTWEQRRDLYGDRLALLAQLDLEYADGVTERIVTDESWTARATGILSDDLYDGERRDLRRPDGDPVPVAPVQYPLDRLVTPRSAPVRTVMERPAERVFRSPSGRLLVDFGQNLVGWVRLTVRAPRDGQEIVIRHAEILEDGELGVRPLRSAKATDSYVLAAADEVVLEPRFTFHGFRYAEMSGLDELDAADATAAVVSSDLERIGWFSCDDPMIERLHENVVWSMRGNFVDVPTDCPQRDERLGWTGDIQVFGPTAAFLSDVTGFLSSWLADLAAEQLPDGTVPLVVPDVLRFWHEPRAAWGDAATIVPWTLYETSGDPAILERQFASMTAWTDLVADLAGPSRLWEGSPQFGDWLDPAAPPDDPEAAKADPGVIATAHLARSAWICARSARVLGRDAEAERYGALHAETVAAFQREYVDAGGRIRSDAQTVYALALQWDLLPADHRGRAGDRLDELVREAGFHVATGFVGTPLILDALTDTGHADSAYRMLQQRECPSWLYPITMGATTVWERWDSMLPDGTINPGEMTSFNHYALGAVADWLHRRVAGLAPAAPGWREVRIAPVPGGGLTRAAAAHVSPFGRIEVSWRIADGEFVLDTLIPDGVTAVVQLPSGTAAHRVAAGRHVFREALTP